MNIERLNRSTADVVTLEDLHIHCRSVASDDEMTIEVVRMGRAAAREAEEHGSLALLNQTIRVTLDGWPRSWTFYLPIAPLLDWSTVEITADGELFDDFTVMTGLRPAIRLIGPRPSGVVVIEYQAGFGDDGASLPDDLREAILDQAANYFDQRGTGDQKSVWLSPHFTRIVGRYRAVRA